MKSDKKILLIILALVLVIGASLWGIVKYEMPFGSNSINITGDGYTDSDLKSGNYVSLNEEKTFKVDNLSSISLGVVSEDLKIIQTNSKDIKINFHGNIKGLNSDNSPKMFITDDGGKFTATMKYKNRIFSNLSSLNTKVEVYIPKDFSGNLKINGVSSDVYVDNFKFDNFDCTTVSGDIKINNLSTNVTNFNTVSGEINVDSFRGETSFKTISGDVKIIYDKLDNNITGSSVSGDINLKLAQDSQFNFNGNSVSGNLNCKFDGTQIVDDKRHLKITVGSGKNNIDLNTVSGDMEVYH